MSLEINAESPTEEARHVLYENTGYDPEFNAMGEDPLDLILELEQLAIENGYTDVHEFINDQLNQIN